MRILHGVVWSLGLSAAMVALVGIARPMRASAGNATFLGFFEYQAGAKFHCDFINEEVVGDGNWGVGGLRIPPLPAGTTAKSLVPFLAKTLPDYKVWRDRVNRSIIHVVDRRVLAWKSNPLNTKLTIKRRVSIAYLQSHIFAKKFPKVRFHDMPFHRVNAIPYFPNLQAFRTPIKFDVRDMTLRRFLTTGIPYSTDPKTGGGGLWGATYQFRGGKLTGRVTIVISGVPVVPPEAVTKPGTKHGD